MAYQIEKNIEVVSEYKRPKLFCVIMHNDDYTTMDFVVNILVKVFGKSEADASRIMMEVHEKGKSVVDVYTYDIARTKKMQAMSLAAEHNFPLKVTVDEAVDE